MQSVDKPAMMDPVECSLEVKSKKGGSATSVLGGVYAVGDKLDGRLTRPVRSIAELLGWQGAIHSQC